MFYNYKNYYIVYLLFILIINCGISKEDHEKLKTEFNKCSTELEDIKNSPQVRINRALKFQQENNLEQAKKEYKEIVAKFPGTDEFKKAESRINEIELKEIKQREEEERKRLLGFKILKESFTTKIGEVLLNFSSFNSSSTFSFDSYEDMYTYRTAERGNIYINTRVSISSDSKDPNLPPIILYKAEKGSLLNIGMMRYEFVWWESFSAYLGNSAAHSNDFSHTRTIPFNTGLEMELTDFNNHAIFIVVKNKNCYSRNYNTYGRPPIRYEENSCDVKSSLKVEDFDLDYKLIKIINKHKL